MADGEGSMADGGGWWVWQMERRAWQMEGQRKERRVYGRWQVERGVYGRWQVERGVWQKGGRVWQMERPAGTVSTGVG